MHYSLTIAFRYFTDLDAPPSGLELEVWDEDGPFDADDLIG